MARRRSGALLPTRSGQLNPFMPSEAVLRMRRARMVGGLALTRSGQRFTRNAFGDPIGRVRPGIGIVIGRRGSRRGGFFGSVFKGIKKVVSAVTKVPVISTIAKTALSSIPVVGSVVTALDKVKRSTVLAAVPQLAKLSAAPGPSTPLAVQSAAAPSTRRPRRKRAKRRGPRRKKRAAPRRSKGTAKQRAARARFARAAKKGRIRKGQRL